MKTASLLGLAVAFVATTGGSACRGPAGDTTSREIAAGDASAPSAPLAPVAPKDDAEARARALLESSRADLRKGDLEAARRALAGAVDVLDEDPVGPLANRDLELLRSLDDQALALSVVRIRVRVRKAIVEVLARSSGPEDLVLLAARQDLAVAQSDLGEYAITRPVFEELLATYRRLLPADSGQVLLALQNVALARFHAGDLAGARTLYEELLASLERLLPPDDSDVLSAKQGLGATKYALGDLPGARTMLEDVLALRARRLPPDDPELLRSRENVAALRWTLGDVAGAHELFVELFAALSRKLPEDHPDLLRLEQNLAGTKLVLGDLAGGRALFEKVLRVYSVRTPADNPEVLGAKQGLAQALKGLGDLAGARELEEVVLEARERLLPEDHSDVLDARTNLAGTMFQLGDIPGACALIESVLAVRERILPAGHPRLLQAQANVAAARYTAGDDAGALAMYEEVLAAYSHAFPADHPEVLNAKRGVASAKYRLGDLEGSRTLHEEVLASAKRAFPVDHPDILRAQENLAVLRYALGDFAGERELEEEVLAARQRLLPPGHPELLRVQATLSVTRHWLGDEEGACALASEALDGVITRVRALQADSPRAAREGALAAFRPIHQILHATDSTAGRALAARTFSAVESLRHVSVASPETALALADHPELARLQQEVASLRSRIHDLVVGGPASGQDAEVRRASLQHLALERDRQEKEIRNALAAAGVFVGAIEASAVAAALEPDAIAVSYLRYPRFSPIDPVTHRAPPYVDSLLAFVVRPDGRVERVDLGPAAAIEEQVTRWRADLGQPVERGVPVTKGAQDDEAEVGSELRRRILDPILKSTGAEPSTLHVVLDDFLHLVPLEALPSDAGERVGDRLAIRYDVSFARLVSPARRRTGSDRLLAVGGIDYDAAGSGEGAVLAAAAPPVRRGGTSDHFEPLRQSRYEVEDVAKQFEEAFGGKAGLLEGEHATKAEIFARASGVRWLHLATHGWFAPDAVRSRAQTVSAPTIEVVGGKGTGLEETVRGFAPMTLCGLALTGANRGRDALASVPGILTAEELAGLDLSVCELAVLSACETNVGPSRAGQGIQSLQGALHAAGARTAITTLWKVDDAASRRLMELFYSRLWHEKKPKAQALWEAKKALRDEGHPVKDWAGWILTGDPR